MSKQKRFANDGVTFMIAIDEVMEALAAGYAISESMKDPRYIDSIVDEAFEKADDHFNVEAAAMENAGTISHMYEWGTQGINKGRSNARMSPMNPAARLWTNFTEGKGLDRIIWFAFRPSVTHVPKPTSAATGMSSEVIKKMRDHIFEWKAEVMEEGQDVTVRPKHSKFLLIPAYKENRPYMRPNDIKRGYQLLQDPVTMNPGEGHFYGNFTAFWLEYWNNTGADIIDAHVNSQILSDYEPEFRKPRTSTTLRPVGTYSVRTEIKARSEKIQKKVIKKARAREIT